jgi:hypothetical protein
MNSGGKAPVTTGRRPSIRAGPETAIGRDTAIAADQASQFFIGIILKCIYLPWVSVTLDRSGTDRCADGHDKSHGSNTQGSF